MAWVNLRLNQTITLPNPQPAFKNMKTKPQVPAATIRGKFNTYENMKFQDLVEKLGHVVTLDLESICRVEIGGWGTMLRLTIPKGIGVKLSTTKQGESLILLQPATL